MRDRVSHIISKTMSVWIWDGFERVKDLILAGRLDYRRSKSDCVFIIVT